MDKYYGATIIVGGDTLSYHEVAAPTKAKGTAALKRIAKEMGGELLDGVTKVEC